MSYPRIYLNTQLQPLATVDIDAEQARYLKQVMRLQAGDMIIVFDGEGGEYQARLSFLAKDGGQCELAQQTQVDRELPCQVHIIQAANRSDKIETVLQKATEMGAASFQVVNSERATLSLPESKRIKRLQRWQKIIIEAAEQSERTAIPTVMWVDKLSQLQAVGACFVLHPRHALMWQDVRDKISDFSAITLAIGPEGGWSNQELEQLQNRGFQALTFGERIMRTETAAPALLAAIQAVV
jgi:16S rRNA (uracil1498-N3)-methyltransferase